MASPRVVGLDLSLTATGVANGNGVPETLTSRLKGCQRLAEIRDAVLDCCAFGWMPDPGCDFPGPHDRDFSGAVVTHVSRPLVVIEGYAFAARNSHAHALGELGGVIRLALHEAGVPYVDVPPSSLKKYACGKGNANKGEMLAAAIRRLDYEGASDNEADALWLRAMGLDALGCPVVKLPEAHRAALAKVEWP